MHQQPRLSAALEEKLRRSDGEREREMKSIVVSRPAPLNVTRRGAGEWNERIRIIVRIYAWIRTPHPPVTHCSFSASHDSLEALGLFPAFVGVTRVSVFLTFCASPDTHASAVQSEKKELGVLHATRRD